MSATVSTDLLLRFLQATPEQQAAIERILQGNDEGRRKNEETGNRTARYVFRQSGKVWLVVFDGRPGFHVEDTLGARYLDYLLHRPNEPVSAFELEVAISPEKGRARDKGTIQHGIDEEAARKYLHEMDGLRAGRDEAADQGNHAEVDRIDGEINVIEAELKQLGRAVDTGERARGNVSKAIMAVRKKLMNWDKHARAFAEHIAEKVSLGYQCNYNSPNGGIWL